MGKNDNLYLGLILLALLAAAWYWYDNNEKESQEAKEAKEAKDKADKEAKDKADKEAKESKLKADKAAEDSRIAKLKADRLTACNAKLNKFSHNGVSYICPPTFSFGNQNKHKNDDLWSFAKDNVPVCYMTRDVSNCFDNTCDPSKYVLPDGTFWENNTIGKWDDVRKNMKTYTPQKYPNMKNIVYAATPMLYSTSYCNK